MNFVVEAARPGRLRSGAQHPSVRLGGQPDMSAGQATPVAAVTVGNPVAGSPQGGSAASSWRCYG